MVPALVFFGIATLVGCVLLVIVWLRLRAVARQPDVTDADVCQLKQANRITSVAVVASLAGLAVVLLAIAVF
jgi:predicted signal transduction protein with EAL and GGDEF domain